MTSSKYSLHEFDIDGCSVIFRNTLDRNKYLLKKKPVPLSSDVPIIW